MKILFLTALGAGLAAAQVREPLRFEVASVRPGNGTVSVKGGCRGIDSMDELTEGQPTPPLGRCVITDGRLSHLIFIAFGLNSMELIQGAPDWAMAGYDRYTVQAKAEDPSKATEAQLMEMLQNLLVERFKLRFHWQTAERPGFRLVVGKNGPKLKQAASGEAVTSFGVRPNSTGPVNMSVRKYSMKMLADALSNFGPKQVVDRTGLPGEYDFDLSWDEKNGPAMTTAVQEQLGLKLEAQKVPVKLFVVDSAEKPKEGAN